MKVRSTSPVIRGVPLYRFAASAPLRTHRIGMLSRSVLSYESVVIGVESTKPLEIGEMRG